MFGKRCMKPGTYRKFTAKQKQTRTQAQTLKVSKVRGRVQMRLRVMAGEAGTYELDGWRKDDDKRDRQRRWGSNSDLGESVSCRQSLSSSPGNFAVTSCHHLVTRCPQHPVTSPLSNRACQSVVMRPESPLTFCFFNTRYREKSWGTRGRAVVSGHAYLPGSQATTNATGAVDLWRHVILCAEPRPGHS